MPSSVQAGRHVSIPFFVNATDLAAKTSQQLVAPFTGYIEEVQTVVQTAIVTGGAVTVSNATGAVTGLSVAIANAATVGTVNSAVAPKAAPNRKVNKGEKIVIGLATFTGGGAIAGNVILRDNIDPQNVKPY